MEEDPDLIRLVKKQVLKPVPRQMLEGYTEEVLSRTKKQRTAEQAPVYRLRWSRPVVGILVPAAAVLLVVAVGLVNLRQQIRPDAVAAKMDQEIQILARLGEDAGEVLTPEMLDNPGLLEEAEELDRFMVAGLSADIPAEDVSGIENEWQMLQELEEGEGALSEDDEELLEELLNLDAAELPT